MTKAISFQEFMNGSYREKTKWNEMKQRFSAIREFSSGDYLTMFTWFIFVPIITAVGVEVVMHLIIIFTDMSVNLQ